MSSFFEVLKRIRKEIFDAAFDVDVCGFQTVNQLADAANLGWTTVDNLRCGSTKEPRLRTIYKLCKAVKMDIALVHEELGIKRKKRKLQKVK